MPDEESQPTPSDCPELADRGSRLANQGVTGAYSYLLMIIVIN
jgi:hypothetical protein